MSESVSEYLARIGRKGGEHSRRTLSRSQSREMTAIREFKRAAAKRGDMGTARKKLKLGGRVTKVARKNLPKIKPQSFRSAAP